VAIIGAGDTAAEEALYLSKICSKIHMIVRKGEMRASKVMQDRVLNTPNIKVYWHNVTDEILGSTKVEGCKDKKHANGRKTGDTRQRLLCCYRPPSQ
jgi:thioredoxin reductase (NADPH)